MSNQEEILKFAAISMGAISDVIEDVIEKNNNTPYVIYINHTKTPNLGNYYFNTENGAVEWNPFKCNEQLLEVARRLCLTLNFERLTVYFRTDTHSFYESFSHETKNSLNFIVMKCASEIGERTGKALNFQSYIQGSERYQFFTEQAAITRDSQKPHSRGREFYATAYDAYAGEDNTYSYIGEPVVTDKMRSDFESESKQHNLDCSIDDSVCCKSADRTPIASHHRMAVLPTCPIGRFGLPFVCGSGDAR
jgi:hypothetical protein